MTVRLSTLAQIVSIAILSTTLGARQEPIDHATIERIRQEGIERSKVGRYFDYFVTVLSPRLTRSPVHKAAADCDWQDPWASERGLTVIPAC